MKNLKGAYLMLELYIFRYNIILFIDLPNENWYSLSVLYRPFVIALGAKVDAGIKVTDKDFVEKNTFPK